MKLSKIKKSKLKFSLFVIILIQIFLLMNMCTANSYIIHQTSPLIEKITGVNKKNENQDKNLINLGINLLTGFLSIKQIGIVSAQNDIDDAIVDAPDNPWNENYWTTNYAASDYAPSLVSWKCCLKTKSGALCQDISSEDKKTCDIGPIPQNCKDTAECRYGCCIDEEEGVCTINTVKGKCEEEGGKWNDEISCLVEDCRNGCCVLGKDVEYTTEKRCLKLSLERSLNLTYLKGVDEISCWVLRETQELGACLLKERNCIIGTEIECKELAGTFFENKLCSAEEVNSICQKQESVSCVEGEDEIYWIDSCGNMENIYSSNKESSWNNGEILTKEESCNSNSNNAESRDCGNCNSLLGSMCVFSELGGRSIKDGDYICRNLDCVDEKGKEWKNGESWCVYDSFIGDGKDTVGSRHWRRICTNGRIETEGCADYRGEICSQSITKGETEEGEKKEFSIAQCVINEALHCIDINKEYKTKDDLGKLEAKCKENKHCIIKNIDIDKGFKFPMCVPRYPRGFDLTGKLGKENGARQLCGLGNQECIAIWEKKISGWKCIMNCDCEKKEFAEKLNDLCISLGDCGSYINYRGAGTDNIKVKNSDEIPWTDYIGYASVVLGQYAESQDLGYSLSKFGMVINPSIETSESGLEKGLGYLSNTASASGGIIFVGSTIGIVSTTQFVTPGLVGAFTYAVPTMLGCVSAGLTAFGVANLVGFILTKAFGLQGDAALVMAAASAVVGVAFGIGVGIAMSGMTLGAGVGGFMAGMGAAMWAVFLAWAWMLFAVLIILAVLMSVLGIGDIKEIKVKFECKPWSPPVGGLMCNKCNTDPFKVCSEYRCSSLGAACELAEETVNTEKPICVGKKNDGTIPIISSGEISYGFKFQNEIEDKKVEIRKEDGKCIPEFNPVIFSLKTDEKAQCRYDLLKKGDYESMTEFFLEETTFTKNHTTALMMPSIESLEAASRPEIGEGEVIDVIYDGERPLTNVYSKGEVCENDEDCESRWECYEQTCAKGIDITTYDECMKSNGKNVCEKYFDPNAREIFEENLRKQFAKTNLYVRCQDIHGNVNDEEYEVNFCVDSGPDQTPPTIIYYEPLNGAYLRLGVTELPLIAYLNEPAECKYDILPDQSYDDMVNTMECNIDLLNGAGSYGWPCETTLANLTEKENIIYIKCKDKPWLDIENDSLRNVNDDDFIYVLYDSKGELIISSISPQGEIETGFEPVSVDLEVETIGGVVGDGLSTCYYSFTGYERMFLFSDTFSNTHKHNFNGIMKGYYEAYVKCEDGAGNTAYANTTFNVTMDSGAPTVVRAYREDNYLKLITNEKAECVYDTSSCDYLFNEGTAITVVDGINHYTDWETNNILYVKCKDESGNLPQPQNTCTIIVKPSKEQ